jgi:hypothetical protein
VRALRAAEALHRAAFWLVAWTFVVAPALHLAHHRDDHVHTPAGIQRRVDAHDHGDGRLHVHVPVHVHVDARIDATSPRAAAPRAADVEAVDGDAGPGSSTPPAPHGEGAADHFGLSLLGAATFVVSAAPTALEPLAPPPPADRIAAPPARRAHPPRGPPGPGARTSARG